jgi:predicted aldo/keto reductase-like oxidoreductase
MASSGKKELSRRQFLINSAAMGALPVIASCSGSGKQPLGSVDAQGPNAPGSGKPSVSTMPYRALGNTGMKVSVLGVGGGTQLHAFLTNAKSDADRQAFFDKAIELGVNYFDTHDGYNTQPYYGQFLVPKYRDKVYITTKSTSKDPAAMQTVLDTALKEMGLDYVDCFLFHDGAGTGDYTSLKNNGWKKMQDLKAAGKVKAIGFSSMSNGAGAKAFIEALQPDVATLALSATNYAQYVSQAIPAAQANNTGVIAMKVFSGTLSKDPALHRTAPELLSWALSQPQVATVIVGMAGGTAQLIENAGYVMQTGVQYDLAAVEKSARPLAGPHALCWARPDYRDGEPYYWS